MSYESYLAHHGVLGTALVRKYLREQGDTKNARIAAYAGIGMEIVNTGMWANNIVQAKYLRAYYGHSRPKDLQ